MPGRSRTIDACLAAVALALTAPLLALLMLLNRLATGRALYTQMRAGQDLRPFRLFKLATMREGSDASGTVTIAGEARVTRFGRFLRIWKLNELPQLVNVLRGEMRLVGPRPLPLEEVARMPLPIARELFRVPPGLTGASAVAYSDEEAVLARVPAPEQEYFTRILPAKVRLELLYAERRTRRTDLILLAGTLPILFAPSLRRRVMNRILPGWETSIEIETLGDEFRRI